MIPVVPDVPEDEPPELPEVPELPELPDELPLAEPECVLDDPQPRTTDK